MVNVLPKPNLTAVWHKDALYRSQLKYILTNLHISDFIVDDGTYWQMQAGGKSSISLPSNVLGTKAPHDLARKEDKVIDFTKMLWDGRNEFAGDTQRF